jgi:hypothetical protein
LTGKPTSGDTPLREIMSPSGAMIILEDAGDKLQISILGHANTKCGIVARDMADTYAEYVGKENTLLTMEPEGQA